MLKKLTHAAFLALLSAFLARPASADDLAGTEVQVSTSASTSYVAVTNIDVRNCGAVDWAIDITSVGSSTDLACQVQVDVAVTSSPVEADYAIMQSESISAGTATQSDYTYSKAAITAVKVLLVSAPARGRWMRIRVKFTATTLGGNYNVKVFRRSVPAGNGQIR